MNFFNKTIVVLVFSLILQLLPANQIMAAIDDDETNSSFQNNSIKQIKAAAQEAKLIVSEVFTNDRFGQSVSLSGNRAAIGVENDDFMGSGSGSVFMYDFDGLNWVKSQRLIASDASTGDHFGASLSLSASGTQVVIGAPSADTEGRVYVFEHNGISWVETQILTPTNANVVNPSFGESVSLSVGRILIGSPLDNELNENSGAAYIFDYDNMNNIWIQSQKLKISGLSLHARLGSSVSLFGFAAVIGAKNEESNGVKVGSAYVFNLNMNNNMWENNQKIIGDGVVIFSGFGSSVSMYSTQMAIAAPREDNNKGYVYTYHLDNGTWMFTEKLSSGEELADNFGSSVSHANNRVIIGARNDDDPVFGVNNLGSVHIFDYDAVNDDWNATQKLTPEDGGNFNKVFGNSVAIDVNDPDQILIGANGDDEMATSSGSAYVVKLEMINWVEEQKLSQADGAVDDRFGNSVSIFGDTAVVGASQDKDMGINSGAVYLFDYVDSNWIFGQKLFASDADTGDFFGSAVSLDNTRLIVGARGKDDNGSFSGAVYEYNHDGNNWVESQIILATDGESGDIFGNSLQLSGDRMIIGAPGDDIPFFSGAGSAYIYDYDSINQEWNESHKLIASDPQFNHDFGISVDVDGDKALIGAWRDDDNGSTAGSAYMFHFDSLNNNWVQQPKFIPLGINASDQFGFGVSLEGDWAVIGAPDKEDDATGSLKIGSTYIYNYVNPNWVNTQKITAGINAQHFDDFGHSVSISGNRILVASKGDNENGANAGAAYVYEFNGVNWFQNQKLTANDGAAGDFFGSSVAISGNKTLVGATGDDNNWIDDGAAYIINVAERYDLSINVSGLAQGNNATFVNGNDTLTITSDSQQILSNLADTASYDVIITNQPTFPNQVCHFDDSGTDTITGTITGNDVVLDVTCTTVQYELSVRVSGIAAGNSIEVTNNLGDNLVLDTNNETKIFPTKIDHRASFTISLVSAQPTTPNQTCDNVTSIMNGDVLRYIFCRTNQYSIGGNVNGLITGNELVLENSIGPALTITTDGGFTFPTKLDDESLYTVNIIGQPRTPHQTCEIANATGQLAGNDVTNVSINCIVSPDLIFHNDFEN